MHPVTVMTCLENNIVLNPGSEFKEKLYTVKMAVLYKKPELGVKPPNIRANLTIESDNPLPYHPGKKYNIRLAEDAGLVVVGNIEDGLGAPGGQS